VGAEIDSSPYLAMDVAAVLVYDRALPASERAQVEAYLREKYLAGPPPPPVASVSITSPADGAVVVGPDVAVSWSGVAAGPGDHVHLALDGGAVVEVGQSGSHVFGGVGAGPHTVTAAVADASHVVYANAEASDDVDFTVVSGGGGSIPTEGLVVHLEADAGVSAAGGAVSAWADQSGRGNDLAALGDPALVPAATPGGHPAIALDGGADGAGDALRRTAALSGLP